LVWLTQPFAADHSDLVLVARRKERLDQLAEELARQYGISARVLVNDLADPVAPTPIYPELATAGVEVDVLVNNAGSGVAGRLNDLPLPRQLEMVQVNAMALTHLTRLLLPAMFQRGRGGILYVGSLAGFQPGPYMAVYYATKAYFSR